MTDPSPRLSAKRPTGRNQPKLPLLIRRDRWIPNRSLFPPLLLISHPPLSSPRPPRPACEKRGKLPGKSRNGAAFRTTGTVLTTRTRYCISDLLQALGPLWLNLPSGCSSFTRDRANGNGERLFFCLQCTVVLSPRHTNHCGSGKDTPLGPTLS